MTDLLGQATALRRRVNDYFPGWVDVVVEDWNHLDKSVIVLVEWIPGAFEPWAELVNAYNVATAR